MARAAGARRPRRHPRVENVEPIGAPERGLATWGEWSALGGERSFLQRRKSSRSARRAQSLATSSTSRNLRRLFVEPPVFAAIAVEDAVDHDRRAFEVRLPAGREPVVEDNWPGDILGELALDRPQYLLAARGVALHRLPL